MIRILIASTVLSFAGIAWACDGTGKCDKANCTMQHAQATNTSVAQHQGPKATLEVTGMKCGSCAGKVQAALQAVPGVVGATVDASTGKAEVAYDDKKTNIDALIAAVQATGHYQAKAAVP